MELLEAIRSSDWDLRMHRLKQLQAQGLTVMLDTVRMGYVSEEGKGLEWIELCEEVAGTLAAGRNKESDIGRVEVARVVHWGERL